MSKRLWAPWRMDFVTKGYKMNSAVLPRERRDRRRPITLARYLHTLLMLNAYPYTNGHLMTAPLRHTAEFDTLLPEVGRDDGNGPARMVSFDRLPS